MLPPDTVGLLSVIKAARRLGFTLDEVAADCPIPFLTIRTTEHPDGDRA